MKTRIKQTLQLILSTLLLVGCSAAIVHEKTAPPVPQPTATAVPERAITTPTATPGSDRAKAAVDLAVADLQGRLERGAEIVVLSLAPVDFSDAGLGTPKAGQQYAQVITSGYVVQLFAEGRVYRYHCSGDRAVLVNSDHALAFKGVHVDADQIVVSGQSALPEGTCIRTALIADGQAQNWWPAESCATVRQGEWQIAVSLGQNGAPAELDGSSMYEVHAWQEGQPSTRLGFPFDLAGPPAPQPRLETTYEPVTIPEVGMTVEAPSDWRRIEPEWAWTPDESGRVQVGVRWMDLEPPALPEAAMLPESAQLLESREVMLNWGSGRSFTFEVYGPAAQGSGEKAPVQAVERHTLFMLERNGVRRAIDLYASAPTLDELNVLAPVLQHMLDSSLLAEGSGAPPSTAPVRPEDWKTFEDETYSFAFGYPPDWTVQEVLADGPGTPEDWPIARILLVLPAEWAEQLAHQGPPDPTRPPVVAPLHVEVCVGPLEQYRRAYVEPDQRKEIEINGLVVSVERDVLSDQITLERYVFTPPQDSELRVVWSDMLTGFEERVRSKQALAEMLPIILATFRFVE
jgi:hypothetical protein